MKRTISARSVALLVRVLFSVAGAGASLAGLVACAQPSASAQLALRNDTGTASSAMSFGHGQGLSLLGGTTSLSSSSTVSHFAMRLSKVYIVSDVDPATEQNVGSVGMIWESPHCSSSGECDWFELARPTDVIATDLASEGLPISPGTYRYARIEFCQNGPQGPNVQWQADGVGTLQEFTLGMCGVTSVKFADPLVVADGDHVKVSLGYDLAGATTVGDITSDSPATSPSLTAPDGHGVGHSSCAANSDPGKKTCFDVPSFTPTASQN